jgi:hypothetical protein
MHVQDFTEKNGEAVMHGMINTGREDGEGDNTQAEPKPDQQAYDICIEPLFPNNSISTEEGLMAGTLAASLASTFADAMRISQRTMSYTPAEEKVLCQVWMAISTDPICGAEQKGFYYWWKVGKFFHEQRKVCEKPFQSDWSDLSLFKRLGTIHAECSKFQGSFEKIQKGKLAGDARKIHA